MPDASPHYIKKFLLVIGIFAVAMVWKRAKDTGV